MSTIRIPEVATPGSAPPTGKVYLYAKADGQMYSMDDGGTETLLGNASLVSFSTIATPAGTSPVADSVTDTLTLTAGTGLTVTGDATTDTVAFALDGTLVALSGLDGTAGLVVETAADTFTKRTIVGTANQIVITNGDGVSGNPTFSTPQDIHTGATPTFVSTTLTGVTASRAVVTTAGQVLDESVTTAAELAHVAGVTSPIQTQIDGKQPLDATLTALAGLNATPGVVVETAADTFTKRTISAGSSKVSVTDGDGVLGNPTVDAVEANFTLNNIGGTLGISKGGTGQTSQTAAFDALAPTTTKGDVIAHNGTDNVRVPVGADTFVLTADATEASGIKWAAQTGGSPTNAFETISTPAGTSPVADSQTDTLTLTAGTGMVITGTAGTDTVDFAVNEAGLTLNSIGGTLAISKGGTGQTTQTAAFDALAPTTTKGDVIVHNGTDNIRVAVGANTFVLTADSAEASGVKWAIGGSGPDNSDALIASEVFC